MVGTIEERDSEGRWVVQAKEILRMIERGEDIKIENRVIKGDLDLSELALEEVRVERERFEIDVMSVSEKCKVVRSSIRIEYCIIEDFVNFSSLILQKVVRFDGTVFNKGVSFRGSKFYKELSFWRTRFNGYIDFDYAEFGRPFVFFMSVHIAGIARFSSAHFRGGANFIDTTFNEISIFIGSQFHAGATFGRSQFDGDAYFVSAQFEGDANFSNVRFGKYLDFTAAKFEKNLDLSGVNINYMKLHTNFKSCSEIVLNDSNFSRLDVRWEWIKDHISYDGAAYLALIKNFKMLEHFEDADECYYKYRQISQSKKHWYEKKKNWLHRFNLSKLYDYISWGSFGYGVRLRFPLSWIFVSILGFAAIYQRFDGIMKSSTPEITMNALNNSTILFTPVPSETSPSFWDCLYFSALSFVGGMPAGLSPVGGWKYAVMFERVLGYLFFALFVVVLARKLVR